MSFPQELKMLEKAHEKGIQRIIIPRAFTWKEAEIYSIEHGKSLPTKEELEASGVDEGNFWTYVKRIDGTQDMAMVGKNHKGQKYYSLIDNESYCYFFYLNKSHIHKPARKMYVKNNEKNLTEFKKKIYDDEIIEDLRKYYIKKFNSELRKNLSIEQEKILIRNAEIFGVFRIEINNVFCWKQAKEAAESKGYSLPSISDLKNAKIDVKVRNYFTYVENEANSMGAIQLGSGDNKFKIETYELVEKAMLKSITDEILPEREWPLGF